MLIERTSHLIPIVVCGIFVVSTDLEVTSRLGGSNLSQEKDEKAIDQVTRKTRKSA
jgi:hypothetical protein